jgi:hypothetical protein
VVCNQWTLVNVDFLPLSDPCFSIHVLEVWEVHWPTQNVGGAWSNSLVLLCWMWLNFAITTLLVSHHLCQDSKGTIQQNLGIQNRPGKKIRQQMTGM